MDKREMDEMLNQMAEILTPLVQQIESRPMVTKDHYAEYIMLLDRVADHMAWPSKDKTNLYLALGVACQRAGGNARGVVSALRVCGYM